MAPAFGRFVLIKSLFREIALVKTVQPKRVEKESGPVPFIFVSV